MLWGLAGTAILACLLIAPSLLWLIPRRVSRAVIDILLRTVLIAFPSAFVLGVIGIVGALVWANRLRRGEVRGRRRRLAWITLAVSLSCVSATLIGEVAAAVVLAIRDHRPGQKRLDLQPGLPRNKQPGRLHLLVLGESSAAGEPYQPYLSVGAIVADAIERANPALKVEIEMAAYGGASLESMEACLPQVKAQPDLVIIYSGHNEFAAHYSWERSVPIGDDAPKRLWADPRGWVRERSRFEECIVRAIDANRVDVPPPPFPSRRLVDLPNHRDSEFRLLLQAFEARLDALTEMFERNGAVVILIAPCANDAGFEPNRSVPSRALSEREREALEERFKHARGLEGDPRAALAAYSEILREHPRFAEARYRSAKLLEALGDLKEAHEAYVQARDDDGEILRCPSSFQEAYRKTARQRPRAILVEAQSVLEAISPAGILDDSLFHDAHHPNLRGYAAIASAVLTKLYASGSFGGLKGTAPAVDPFECARRFHVDGERWIEVCGRSQFFYLRTATIRHDPTTRRAWILRYAKAIEKLKSGSTPEATGVPSLDLSGATRPIRDASGEKSGRAGSTSRGLSEASTCRSDMSRAED